jgi:quercetin dioxygenase-like cupin family protein
MQKVSLDALAREQLAAAGRAESDRAATTVVGGHERVLRQTVVALVQGASMADHENPGEATLYVISGRVELRAGGDLIEIPPARHAVHAIEDSALLLTAVPLARAGQAQVPSAS